MIEIKTYAGDYDRGEFYSHAGSFFAEPEYKNKIPYLQNRTGTVWFLALDNNKIVGFASVLEEATRIKFVDFYVIEECLDEKLQERLNKKRFDYTKDTQKPICVITEFDERVKYWKTKGFVEQRTNGKYHYLIKEVSNEKPNK